MKKDQQVTNVRIDGIKISVELPPFFISPDIEKGMNYYKTYLSEAIAEGKAVRTPPSYLNEILRQVGETGARRQEILDHYGRHVGSKRVLQQMEDSWFIFNEAKDEKTFVRITDKNQASETYSLTVTKMLIEGLLLNGKSIMLEPIKFKEKGSKNETVTK